MKPTHKAVDLFRSAGWNDQDLEAQGYVMGGEPQPAILEALRANDWSDEAIVEQGLAEQEGKVKPDEKVTRYITIRDELTRMNNVLKEKQAPYKEEMENIEGELGTILMDMGQSTMKSDSGTFFFVDKSQVGTEDYESFMRWVLGTIITKLVKDEIIPADTNSYDAVDSAMDAMGLNFLTQAVKKESVVEYLKENGTPPPGLKHETVREVQVRRPTKKK